jgi:plastocyanin
VANRSATRKRVRRRSIAAGAVATVACVAAFGGTAGAGGGSKTVKLGDNFFDPARTSVQKGTKVRFKWVDTNENHNVAKKKGPGGDFASETTDEPGVHFAKKFKKAGRYKLICTIHPEKMVLRLRVKN